MIWLEDQLLNNIYAGKKKEAFHTYDQLYGFFQSLDIGDGCVVRSLKNHMIAFNALLYKNVLLNTACKKRMYAHRINFLKKIEGQKKADQLYVLGKEMVASALHLRKEKHPLTKHSIINRALGYIHDHLDGDLTLQKVSKEVHVSANYLSSLFCKHTGHSFSEYIRVVKVEKAKSLLQDPALSLLDIALECGFNSQSYFCYVFRMLENMSPKQYRMILHKASM